MRIFVKADGRRIAMWFPLSMLKTRIGYNVAKRALEGNSRRDTDEQHVSPEVQIHSTKATEPSLTRQQVVQMYKLLRQFIKQHGHFNLIEVDSHDGEKVLIRV